VWMVETRIRIPLGLPVKAAVQNSSEPVFEPALSFPAGRYSVDTAKRSKKGIIRAEEGEAVAAFRVAVDLHSDANPFKSRVRFAGAFSPPNRRTP
jgi:hypothetical protein